MITREPYTHLCSQSQGSRKVAHGVSPKPTRHRLGVVHERRTRLACDHRRYRNHGVTLGARRQKGLRTWLARKMVDNMVDKTTAVQETEKKHIFKRLEKRLKGRHNGSQSSG